jgi:hypothetical protein
MPSYRPLPDEAIKALFGGETLYRTLNEQSRSFSSADDQNSENTSKLSNGVEHAPVWLVLPCKMEALSSQARDMLYNLIQKGLRKNIEKDIRFLRMDEFQSTRAARADHWVIAFLGPALKLEGRFLSQGVHAFDGGTLVVAPLPEELVADRNAKARLWKTLKQAFGL